MVLGFFNPKEGVGTSDGDSRENAPAERFQRRWDSETSTPVPQTSVHLDP